MNRGSVLGVFGMSRADEQHPAGHVVPLPGGGLVDEPGQQSDHRAAGGHGQRRAGVLAGLGAEPAQELLGVLAVQLVEVGDLRVGRGEPFDSRRSASRA